MKTKLLMALISFALFSQMACSQTVKTVKLSTVLATTVALNHSVYKQNIFALKVFKNNSEALTGGLKVNEYYCLPMKDNVSLVAYVRPQPLLTGGSIENTTSYLGNPIK